MIDVLEPSQVYSAGEYARAAREAIAEISGRGHLPIIVGGTGFYLRALLEGLPPLPGRDQSLRLRLADRERRRAGSLHRLLTRLDPSAAAGIHPRDTQKLTRALELRMLTRGPRPSTANAEGLSGYTTIKIGLRPDRAGLSEVLDARAREMFRSGLIEEVRGLLEAGCTGAEKPFESLGYRQALAFVRGSMTLEDAISSTAIETRQYAKRQGTWFRRDREIVWLNGFGDSPEATAQARDLLRKSTRPNEP
jgi:tRNA dimethylallyltransferase